MRECAKRQVQLAFLCPFGLLLGQLCCGSILLAGIGAITIYAQLMTMQPIRQGIVMHVGRGEDGAMRQAALTVHTNVQFHAQVPLLPLAGLVHFSIACLLEVLG